MELSYDWKGFQNFFNRSKKGTTPVPGGPILLVTEGDTIICPFAESEDLSDWIGASLAEMNRHFEHRDFVLFERSEVDQELDSAVQLPHFYSQLSQLKERLLPNIVSKSTFGRGGERSPRKAQREFVERLSKKHFLLQALDGWWSKILPSSYGVLIRVESGRLFEDFLLMVKRGRIDVYHQPDLSILGADRVRQAPDVVRYLAEKHMVPVQGVFLTESLWKEVSDSPHPWSQLARAVRKREAQLVPFRWGVASILATRACVGI